jgi:hypothetical protein
MLGKIFEIKGNHCLIFYSYSHPEIWEFQGVTASTDLAKVMAKPWTVTPTGAAPFLKASFYTSLGPGLAATMANVGGVRKSEGVPKHVSYEERHAIHESHGDKESLKVCARLKSCEPLYTCPRAPFYRETKGLLHSENTLESEEYS